MKISPWIAALFVLTLAGCHPTMSTQSDRPVTAPAADGSIINSVTDWPLKFRAHYFGSACYSTQSCKVLYAGMPEHAMFEGEENKPSPPHDPAIPLEKVLRAGRGPIANFPPPAVVDWRSADGTMHHAEVDIGEIFKDQLIRHNVPREEVFNGNNLPPPQIILEVNDRTVNVYMKAAVWTKHEQKPGNEHSDVRRDLIKVHSHTY
jgi:hypothetical protein